MKTIYTILPIYDSLAKRDWQRTGALIPVSCPRHRLPSFQWLDDADGATTIQSIELLNNTYPGTITNPATTWAIHSGFQLGGDSNHFTHTGLEISDAENDTSAGPICHADTNTFAVVKYSTIRVKGTFTIVSGAATHTLSLGSNSQSIVAGAIDKSFVVATDDAAAFIKLESTGATKYTFTGVTITLSTGFNITSYFPTLTTLAHDYFTYSGDTLNYLLPLGVYYLRITMNNDCIYYSEWISIDNIYPNLITSWDNIGYETATTSGTTISSLINSAGSGTIYSGYFNVVKGEKIKVVFYLIKNSGTLPTVNLINVGWVLSDGENLVEGLNSVELTSPFTGSGRIAIYNNASNVNLSTSEIFIFREYSEKYIRIDFHDTHDLGDIYYHGGFTQTAWLETRLNTPSHEPVMIGDEKNGIFIAEKIVTKFKFRIIAYMGAVLYRALIKLSQHDDILITDEVGFTYTPKVGNLEVKPVSMNSFDTGTVEISFNDNSETIWTSESNNLT